MSAPLEAVLVHSMPGRLRLRLARPRDPGLEALAAELAGRPGILKVSFRAETGSLLILHDGRFRPQDDPALRLVQRAAPGAAAKSAPKPSSAAPTRVAAASRTGDLAGAAAFSGLALLQMARGRVMPPAITLLWYAATLLAGRTRRPGA